MDIIEDIEDWGRRFQAWKPRTGNDDLTDYPFVKNRRAPFTPARRALPMLNLALISSAGAYIDGTQPFDLNSATGDASFREIPLEVDPGIFSSQPEDTTRRQFTKIRIRSCRFRDCLSLSRTESSDN